MTDDINREPSAEGSAEKAKRQKLNVILMIVGLLVAGISFVWHIVSIFLKN